MAKPLVDLYPELPAAEIAALEDFRMMLSKLPPATLNDLATVIEHGSYIEEVVGIVVDEIHR